MNILEFIVTGNNQNYQLSTSSHLDSLRYIRTRIHASLIDTRMREIQGIA